MPAKHAGLKASGSNSSYYTVPSAKEPSIQCHTSCSINENGWHACRLFCLRLHNCIYTTGICTFEKKLGGCYLELSTGDLEVHTFYLFCFVYSEDHAAWIINLQTGRLASGVWRRASFIISPSECGFKCQKLVTFSKYADHVKWCHYIYLLIYYILSIGERPYCLSVSDLISPLKSSHFQNSSILFIRFLVCGTSDQVTVDAFGNHLG
jgi:hypothetical protein